MLVLDHTHSSDYNGLMSVEDADKSFQSSGQVEEFLDLAGDLLIRHDLHELLAVRLLHKHNDISSGEIMLEGLEMLDGDVEAVVTQKVRVVDADDVFTPSIWKCLRDGAIMPLEFTTKPVGEVNREFFKRYRDLFAAFNALTRDFGLEDTLGLALRTFKLKTADHEVLVEHVEADRVANVVLAEGVATLNVERIIQTTWEYTNDPLMGCKKMYCSNNCKIIGGGQSHDPYHGYVHGSDEY